MFHLAHFTDVSAYAAASTPLLMRNEAANNLILGLISRGLQNPSDIDYMGCVYAQDQVVAVAWRTKEMNILIADGSDLDALEIIAKDALERFQNLGGVTGSRKETEHFAHIWQRLTHRPFHTSMDQRIYQLTEVTPAQRVIAQMRSVEPEDLPLIRQWMYEFIIEAMPENSTSPDKVEMVIQSRFPSTSEKGLTILGIDGVPVSFAGYQGPTPNGIRIGPVYTPPAQRGHGYASALVAHLSQHLLSLGYTMCFLYTDLANPTSNKIYQAIGYSPVCDTVMIHFSKERPA